MTEEIRRMELGDDDADVGRLTPAQKECLRLVMAGFKTKEIAYRLGIGVDAVNKRLAGAKATLGSPSRFHAARRLASHEAPSTYHSAVGSVSAVGLEAPIVAFSGDDGTTARHPAELVGCPGGCEEASSSSALSAPEPADAGTQVETAWLHIGRRCAGAFTIAAAVGAVLRVLMRT